MRWMKRCIILVSRLLMEVCVLLTFRGWWVEGPVIMLISSLSMWVCLHAWLCECIHTDHMCGLTWGGWWVAGLGLASYWFPACRWWSARTAAWWTAHGPPCWTSCRTIACTYKRRTALGYCHKDPWTRIRSYIHSTTVSFYQSKVQFNAAILGRAEYPKRTNV